MKTYRGSFRFLILAVLFVTLSHDQTFAQTSKAPVQTTEPVTTQPPTSAPVTSSTPKTTPAPVTSSTPKTTPAPVTSSTPKTTPAPVTSSTPKTTPAPVTSSTPKTTPAPVTSSTPKTTTAPVTTPAVTTQAPDAVLNFTVSSNNSVCLRARFSLLITIAYAASSNGTNRTAFYPLKVRQYTSAVGVCASDFNSLSFTFDSVVNAPWTVHFNYTLRDNVYQLDTLGINYDTSNFPDVLNAGKHTLAASGLGQFTAARQNSYKCFAKTDVTLNGTTVTFEFTNYQAEPFMDPKSKDFDTAIECSADVSETSKLVPIIVGSALALLIVLVLIAYLIGRRKQRTSYNPL